MRHLIIIDPIEQLNLQLDSSLKLARAFVALGDEVRFAQVETLAARFQDQTANAQTYALDLKNLANNKSKSEFANEPLTDFSSIHMRKEPPFNLDYVSACWLLAMRPAKRPPVYNDPDALLRLNEKLAIFHFPDFADRAFVCQTAEEAMEFTQAVGDVIVKPLDLFGGRGVDRIRTEGRDRSEILVLLKKSFTGGLRILQPFNEKIYQGEVRVFGFQDKDLSWCLKIPKEGSFFANTREGATLHPYKPSAELKRKVKSMGQKLHAMGASVWGIDVIGEKLSEINFTSPRLLLVDANEEEKYVEFAELIKKDIVLHGGR